MQDYKIKKMSEKRIKCWIKEIDHLLDYYQRKIRLDVCGLCGICGMECGVCLWKIIDNSHCSDFKRKLGYKSGICFARNCKRWREARIPMLRRWEKILKAELARRKV